MPAQGSRCCSKCPPTSCQTVWREGGATLCGILIGIKNHRGRHSPHELVRSASPQASTVLALSRWPTDWDSELSKRNSRQVRKPGRPDIGNLASPKLCCPKCWVCKNRLLQADNPKSAACQSECPIRRPENPKLENSDSPTIKSATPGRRPGSWAAGAQTLEFRTADLAVRKPVRKSGKPVREHENSRQCDPKIQKKVRGKGQANPKVRKYDSPELEPKFPKALQRPLTAPHVLFGCMVSPAVQCTSATLSVNFFCFHQFKTLALQLPLPIVRGLAWENCTYLRASIPDRWQCMCNTDGNPVGKSFVKPQTLRRSESQILKSEGRGNNGNEAESTIPRHSGMPCKLVAITTARKTATK